ncbi:probable G-protein coupled receptor 158 [Polyodon spathula]|uniref:probable G-protein coupled receptor 158 n=1 Tax=Polyodon spathula TaxID=7913 RepID=UPI001B7EEDBA|nr:probable G-protein coupled receptor 158 [Polyodon spathula]
MDVLLLHLFLSAHTVIASGLGTFTFQKRSTWGWGWTVPPSSTPGYGTTAQADPVSPDGLEAAEAFLYSGDVSKLTQANCSQRYQLKGLPGSPSGALRPYLSSALDTLTHAANFLNMIFQTNDIRESSVKEDVEWYHALVRSIVAGDPKIYRALLTFDAQAASVRPQLVLQATREQGLGEIVLRDLSSAWEILRMGSDASDWFAGLKFWEGPSPASFLHKRVLSNDLRTLDTPKWSRGDSYVMDRGQVRWSGAPFLECQAGRFVPGWMVTLSTSFYGLKPNLSPEFRGVIRIDVNLQGFDIDQCSPGEAWFSDTHQCNHTSTQCIPLKGQGFRLNQYRCVCLPGFYSATASSTQNSRRKEDGLLNDRRPREEDAGTVLECLPCPPGCPLCHDGAPCSVQEDLYLRAAVLTVQAFCVLLVFISMLVAYHFRRTKRIRASGLLLLETILFGSLLLYFPVFIMYFKPSTVRCILLRWVRMLGFAIVYGTVNLKMYRVLKVFLSRTAQRVPYMTSWRVLKMLAVIVLMVSWFLSAWTAGVLENLDRDVPLLVISQTPEGLGFSMCDLDRWDYMMALAELLFLCWGSFLCYTVRTVPSAFHEPRYMGIAIHNEILISTTFHLLRFLMLPSLHPDWMLLLFFAHTHVTITITLALLFIPKFLHVSSPLREEIAAEVYEDELDMRRSGSYLNSSITSEHSLDPDDIRDELKKLYAQLEVHKTKKMTANNPHLQKKRSARRGLGRSIIKRITEIPESMSRQYSREDKEGSLARAGGGGGGGSHQGSCKKKPFESTSSSMKMKEDSIKHRVFSLRKSHSTYDHVRDHKDQHNPHHPHPHRAGEGKDPSLLDSLMRKKLAKKASERSDSDSVDAAPLVCKSASAHNLTANKKPLHPNKPSKLQKSLSVMAGAKNKAPLLTGKAHSLEDNSKMRGKRQEEETEKGRRPADQGGPKDHLQELESRAWETAQWIVSGDVTQRSVNTLLKEDFDKEEVCPWELEDLALESKPQKHVSYGPLKRDATNGDHGKEQPPEVEPRQQAHKGEICLPPGTSKEDSCPLEGEELPSKTPAEDIFPWDPDLPQEMETDKARAPVSFSAPGSPTVGFWKMKDSRGFSHRAPAKGFGLSMKGLGGRGREGSGKEKVKKGTEKQREKKDDAKKNKEKAAAKPKQGEVCCGKSGEAKGNGCKGADVSPWDPEGSPWDVKQDEEGVTPSKDRREDKLAAVCPWDAEEPKSNTVGKTSEGCLWDTSKAPSVKNEHKNVSEPASRTRTQQSTLGDICPGDAVQVKLGFEAKDNAGAMQETTKRQASQDSKASEVCPLDVPEPAEKTPRSQESALADDCPWEIEEPKAGCQNQDSSKVSEVCPWEATKAATNNTKKQDSRTKWQGSAVGDNSKDVADPESISTCRQDMEAPEMEELKAQSSSTKSRTTSRESDLALGRRDVLCPWEMEEVKSKELDEAEDVGKSALGGVHPSEAEKTGVKKVDVCPWDFE